MLKRTVELSLYMEYDYDGEEVMYRIVAGGRHRGGVAVRNGDVPLPLRADVIDSIAEELRNDLWGAILHLADPQMDLFHPVDVPPW